jgi:hypothetical protein
MSRYPMPLWVSISCFLTQLFTRSRNPPKHNFITIPRKLLSWRKTRRKLLSLNLRRRNRLKAVVTSKSPLRSFPIVQLSTLTSPGLLMSTLPSWSKLRILLLLPQLTHFLVLELRTRRTPTPSLNHDSPVFFFFFFKSKFYIPVPERSPVVTTWCVTTIKREKKSFPETSTAPHTAKTPLTA